MAKYAAGYLSPIKNKLGNAVGRKWRNIDVLAVYQPNVRNPRTEAQMANRNKLALVSELGAMLRSTIRLGFKGVTDGTKTFPRAKFVSENIAVMPTTGTISTYSGIKVAMGSCPTPIFELADFTTPQTVKVEWDGTALNDVMPASVIENIKVVVVALNPDYGLSIQSRPTTFDRGSISLVVPDSWNGLNVKTWGFAYYDGTDNAEVGLSKGMASDSTYLGDGNIN